MFHRKLKFSTEIGQLLRYTVLSDADEDDYGQKFEENSGRSSTLEFDQAVLDISATSLDISVRVFHTGMESLDSPSAFECENFLEKDISPLK